MKTATILSAVLVTCFCLAQSTSRPKPGCRKQGLEKLIQIDGCQVVKVKINACRGCCRSDAIPSDQETITRSNGRHNITSRASCCSIVATTMKSFLIECGGETRNETIRSATKCECDLCREY